MSCATSALRTSGERLKGTLKGAPRRGRGPSPGRRWSRGRPSARRGRGGDRGGEAGVWLVQGDEDGLVRCHVSLVKHCLGLLLGVPRQQIAPGRVAESGGQGPCVDFAATEGERAVEGATQNCDKDVPSSFRTAHILRQGSVHQNAVEHLCL